MKPPFTGWSADYTGRDGMTNWDTRLEPVGPSRWTFPPVSAWPDHDVIAIGGDLEPATVIGAYRRGIFPMVLETPEPVLAWWSPEPRGILPIDNLHVSQSLRRSARRYEVRVDTCFGDVIRACADPSRAGQWARRPSPHRHPRSPHHQATGPRRHHHIRVGTVRSRTAKARPRARR